jgi:hypothetical protein
MKPKKIVPGVMLGMCMMQPVWANHISYKAPQDLCDNKDLSCHKDNILPVNANGSLQSSTDKHEWAPVFGHVYGYDNVIEVRFRFDQDAIDILNHRHDGWQPFGFEIDMTERKAPPYTIDFDSIEFSCTPCSKAYMDSLYGVKDTSLSNSINMYKNGQGYLIRDASKLKAGIDYVVRFILNDPLPVDGVSVIPNFQIDHHVDSYFGVSATKPNESPFYFYVLETDGFTPNQDWKLYRNGQEGLRWDDKDNSRKDNRFITIPGWPYASNNYDLDKGKRLDYFDKVCRQVNPNPAVEQFRNLATGHITIYKTPADTLGQRYGNADCGVGAFGLPSSLDGDGSGSGSTSGTAVSSKPNLVAIDTFVTTGESASSTRLTESSKTFLGTPIWCQMRTKNSGSANAGAFDSACYVSVGKKFDGWNDAKSLGLARTQSLAKGGATNTEHKGIDILVYPNWYNVVSKIDPNNAVAETNETDNSYNKDNPFSFQIWGRPNIVANVSADKASYTLSETVSLTASFANTGANPYGKTGYVDWYVDGALLSEQDRILREHLNPGVSGKVENVSFPAPQSYGTHEIKACFRYAIEDLVEEVQPADNCAVNTFSVPDPTPPVIVVAPEAPPPPDTTGSDGSSSYTPPTTTPAPLTPAEEEDEMNAVHILLNGI